MIEENGEEGEVKKRMKNGEEEEEKSKRWGLRGKSWEGGGIKWRRHERAISHSWVASTKFPINHAVILKQHAYLYFLFSLTISFNHNILLSYANHSHLHKYILSKLFIQISNVYHQSQILTKTKNQIYIDLFNSVE